MARAVLYEQGDQLLAAWGQPGQCLTQRCVALGGAQLLGRGGVLVRDGPGVRPMTGGVCPASRALDSCAFPLGRGGQPPGQRGGIPDLVQVVGELQPDALADVVGVGAAETLPAADGPDQRGVPLDERLPGLLLAVSGAGLVPSAADPAGRSATTSTKPSSAWPVASSAGVGWPACHFWLCEVPGPVAVSSEAS
jgi:hypothetical protein